MRIDPPIRIANAVRKIVAAYGDDWPYDGEVYRYVMGLVERPLIEETLKINGGNVSRAAHALGINRNTLRSHARRHGLKL